MTRTKKTETVNYIPPGVIRKKMKDPSAEEQMLIGTFADGDTILMEIQSKLHLEPGMIDEFYEQDDGVYFFSTTDGAEYLLFESEEKAEQKARERVMEDLENEPSLFNKEWLRGFIDTSNLKRQLEPDVYDYNYSYFVDISQESDVKFGSRVVRELVENGYLSESDVLDETTNDPKQPDEIEMYDDAVENAVRDMTDDQLSDPISYLEDIYGNEALDKAIEIGGVEIDKATDNAIAVDGWQHFLATYDGSSISLPSGKVIVRIN